MLLDFYETPAGIDRNTLLVKPRGGISVRIEVEVEVVGDNQNVNLARGIAEPAEILPSLAATASVEATNSIVTIVLLICHCQY